MKKSILLALLMLVAAMQWPVTAQIVTTDPSPLQENSKEVELIYHAELGNGALAGLTSSTQIYAHIGVITNLSNGQWKYAPSWLDNSDKYALEYLGPNEWLLYLGDMREYFGITNPNEHIQKIALVFRDATGSREGKTATGGDIFVDVLPDGFQMLLVSDAPSVLNSNNNTVTFTVTTTQPAEVSLSVDGDAPFAVSPKASTAFSASYTFGQGKSYVVTATAVAAISDETITSSLSLVYPGHSPEAAYPGGQPKQGAVAQPDGSVIFCIAAPGKSNAMVIGSWADYKVTADGVMNYTDVNGIRYFWKRVSGLDPNTDYPYYYLIDETTAVGDPYARLVLDPFSDRWLNDGICPGMIPYPKDKVSGNVMLAVYKGTRDDYPWRVTNFRGVDKDDLIIYELLLRDFTGTEGRALGNGTVRKAMEKLDYLQRLGVNAIELMPIQEFNGNNSWGYNTNFYFAPDKAYGNIDDYRAFIDECHSRGMAVILDVVFNQSEGLHPWYQLYPAGSNPFYNERAPHAYSVLNDWNQDNLLVRQQWKDMVEYWMKAYKADGFRFDLVKGLGTNESYGGNASEYNTNRYNASRVEHMKEITDVMLAINPYSYSINENLAGAKEENEMAANGQLNWANINEPAGQFAMGYQSDSNCNRFYAPLDDNRTWGSTISYAESHDEQRLAYKQDQWGVPGVKGNLAMSMRRLGSVAAQMLLCPGGHMIWQFGELGNATSTKNPDGSNNTDPKPVYWNYLNNPDRAGLYTSYCELASIRNENRDLFAPDANFAVYCSERQWDNGRTILASNAAGKELICAINPTSATLTVTGVKFNKKTNNAYKVASKSYNTNVAFDAAAGTVTLEPGAYAVITTSNVSDIENVVADAKAPTAVVYGAPGEIVVKGDYNNVAVYDLAGRRYSTLRVPAGLYIVNVDGRATKVLVR